MMSQHGGQLPPTYNDLHKLPGFGDYTAGAVASIAFGVVVPAIDGNVKRVLARLFAIQSDLTRREGTNQLLDFATQLVQRSSELQPEPKIAGEWNQSLIELGALICLPQNPHCGECPIHNYCQAYQQDLVADLPWRKGKKTLPHYNVTAAVIQSDDKFLIAQRPLKGMLGGLWEFPGGKQEVGETLPACLKREIQEELGVEIEVGELLTIIKHSYTHFKITLHAFAAQMLPNQQPQALGVADWQWVTRAELANYAFPRTDSQIIEKLAGKP
jgi:A/G-specific adenine glycosylase